MTTYKDEPPVVVRRKAAPVALHETVELEQHGGRWVVAHVRSGRPVAFVPLVHAVAKSFDGVRLTDVAQQVGLNFRQDDFALGMSNDVHGMMGGGLCWLDFNDDGRLDLFAVNSYTDAERAVLEAHGGLPRSALFENVGAGRFVDVSKRSHADIAVQGNGCVAGDFNGDGTTDLLVTTNTYNVLLWNNGNGTFTNGTHAAGIDAFGTFGWHTGAAVADVNGDGRPDIFVSGYADVNAPHDSSGGFPTNFQAVPRPALPERGPGRARPLALPRRRAEGRDRARARRPRSRRRLHRRERRRAARPLRRERPRPEPAVRQRARRPARLPLRRARARAERVADRERRHGRRGAGLQRRRPARPVRHELAQPGSRRVPHDEPVRLRRRAGSVRARRRHERHGLGRLVGRPREQRARRTSCSRTARFPSRT